MDHKDTGAGLPVPPPDLIRRVAGTDNIEWFETVGRRAVDEFGEALALIQRRYEDLHSIYDFGCGCGRVTRWLVRRAGHARLYASDIDREAVTWLQACLPRVDGRLNDWLPHLPFPNQAFDLVLSLSVFTHLPEDYQDAWLEELRRVTRPGAVLLLTVHGPTHWEYVLEKSFATAPNRDELDGEIKRKGILHYRYDDWDPHFPDYYHMTWHLPDYIRRHWSRWFQVEHILEAKALSVQDIVVLTRA